MNYFRPAAERGTANFAWLNAKYSFSFGDYYDPDHMGFSSLRVINEDRIAPNGGFPTHGHRDMEIITVVLGGGLSHKDSMGNGSTIQPGDIQVMSAGTGVRHSEFNASETDPVHLLQIWIQPDLEGVEPAYGQKQFLREDRHGRLRLLVSADGRDESLRINQDANLYGCVLSAGQTITHSGAIKRKFWVQMISGDIQVNNQRLSEGDGFGIDHTTTVEIVANAPSEFLLFELEKE